MPHAHVSQATPYHWCLWLVSERLASKTSLRLAVYHVLYFRDTPVTSVTVISQFTYPIGVISTFGDNRDVLCMRIFITTILQILKVAAVSMCLHNSGEVAHYRITVWLHFCLKAIYQSEHIDYQCAHCRPLAKAF